MSTNVYSVNGWLTVTATSAAAAQTAAKTAIADIKSSLTTLANGTELSVVEDQNHNVEFDLPDGENGTFSAECQLLVAADTQGDAQTAAQAASTSINSAISGLSGTSVTLEEETGGAEGGYVFDLLQ